MTSKEFCYWLQGYFELSDDPGSLSDRQVDLIRRHLNLVFKHEIDPSYGDEQKQKELMEAHNKPYPYLPHLTQREPFNPSSTLIKC